MNYLRIPSVLIIVIYWFSHLSTFIAKFRTWFSYSFLSKLSFSPRRLHGACVWLVPGLTLPMLVICTSTVSQQLTLPWLYFKSFLKWCRFPHANCLELWLRLSGYVLLQNLLFLDINLNIKHLYNPAISGLQSFRPLSVSSSGSNSVSFTSSSYFPAISCLFLYHPPTLNCLF